VSTLPKTIRLGFNQYMTNTQNTYREAALVMSMLELAAELDKGINGDLNWLKYMGPMVREAAAIIHHNYSDAPMPKYSDGPLTSAS
jgi:hypothetical protein